MFLCDKCYYLTTNCDDQFYCLNEEASENGFDYITCFKSDGVTCPFFIKDNSNSGDKYDVINRPEHYTAGGIECIDAMAAAFGPETIKNFCICNAFKYIWRHDHKGGDEDIKKSIWYLNKYLELNTEK